MKLSRALALSFLAAWVFSISPREISRFARADQIDAGKASAPTMGLSGFAEDINGRGFGGAIPALVARARASATAGPAAAAEGNYRLARIEVTRKYGPGDWLPASSYQPGTQVYGPEQRSFPLGWDFRWGDNKANTNHAMSEVTLTQLPTTVAPWVSTTLAAHMHGEWNTTGYGNGRNHLIRLTGAAGDGHWEYGGDPTGTYQGEFDTSNKMATPQQDGNRLLLTLSASLRFGDDHAGDMEIRLIYEPGGAPAGGRAAETLPSRRATPEVAAAEIGPAVKATPEVRAVETRASGNCPRLLTGQMEELVVPNTKPVKLLSQTVLEAGKTYVIEACGTFDDWGNKAYGIDAVWCFAEWRCGREGLAWNQLRIDEKGMTEIAGQNIPYNPRHVYRVNYVGQGKPVQFYLSDAQASWEDNLGEATVRIYGSAAAVGVATGSTSEIQASRNATPEVTAVDPSQARRGSEVDLRMTGRNFFTSTGIGFLNPAIRVLELIVSGSTQISAHIQIPQDAPVGTTSLYVYNPGGRRAEVPFTVIGEPGTPAAPVRPPTTAPQGPAPPTPAGLIAWWRFDEGSGNIAHDSSGNGNNATLMRGPSWVAGRIGRALSLNGDDAYVATEVDVQPSAMPSTTWTAWVYPTRVNYKKRQLILSDNDGGNDRSVLIAADTAHFAVLTGTGIWVATSVDAKRWQHIAVVYTPSGIEFYKNGIRYPSGQIPRGQESHFKLQIGRNPGFGEYFEGLIDEVRIYNRALSAAEIQAIYNSDMAGGRLVAIR